MSEESVKNSAGESPRKLAEGSVAGAISPARILTPATPIEPSVYRNDRCLFRESLITTNRIKWPTIAAAII